MQSKAVAMQESRDVFLTYLHQRPWAQIVEKFNKPQTGKPSQAVNFFTKDKFNKYSVQPSWKQLIVQKERELCVSPEGTAAAGPQTVVSHEGTAATGPQTVMSPEDTAAAGPQTVVSPEGTAAAGPQTVVAKTQEEPQPGTNRLSSGHQMAQPAVTKRQHQGKMKGRLPYPRASWLTRVEQKLYLELYDKYMSYVPTKASAAEMKEIHQLKELQLRVAVEQTEYMSFLETTARTFPEDYAYIHTEASTYIEEHLSWKRSRVTSYPRYYTILDSVSLAPPRSIAEHVSFIHLKTLLCVGTVPKVILPNVRPGMRPHVPLNYAKVNCNFPAASINNTSKKVCSVDETAERLALKYKVDVVISASGLKCLMDNTAPVFLHSWELPVVVREYPAEGESPYRVVYVDQPFVPKVMSVREKNTCYYKAALKTLLQHPRHGNQSQSRTTDEAGTSLAEGADDLNGELFSSVTTCLEDLETFGTGIRATKLRQGQRCKMGNEAKVKPEEIISQSVRNLKVELREGVHVNDGENRGRINEMRSLRGTETSQVDIVNTRLMDTDTQVADCPVRTQEPDTVAPTPSTDKTKGDSVVNRKQLDDAEFSLDINSSDSDSDNALVIDISANCDSQEGEGSDANTMSGIVGQSRARSEVMPMSEARVEMLQGVLELGSETVGNRESAVTEIKHEINSDVNSSVHIEIKDEINETETNFENPIGADEKDVQKEEVKVEEIKEVEMTPRTLPLKVVTCQGRDDTADTASDMSTPRRRSQRCRTRATNDNVSFLSDTTSMVELPLRRSLRSTSDVSSLSDVTSTVGTPLRRSLRSAVTRSATGGLSGGKTQAEDRRRTKSGPGRRKTRVEGQDTGQDGPTQCHVSDTQTDIDTRQTPLHEDSTAAKRRRSSRMTTRAQREMTTAEVANDTGVTTRSKRCRSQQLDTSRSVEVVSESPESGSVQRSPASEDRTTCRIVEQTREEAEEETQEKKTRMQEEDTDVRTSPDIEGALGDNQSCVIGSDIAGELTDISSNKSSENAAGPHSVVGSSGNQCTDFANGNDSTDEVMSNNLTNLVNPEVSDLSDVIRTVATSDVQTNTRNDSDVGSSDRNVGGARRISIDSTKEGCSEAKVSVKVGKETRDERDDAGGVSFTRSKSQTQKRKRQTAVENTSSNQRQPKAPCPTPGHTPLDEILLAQQKLLQPTYPSRQQSSVLPPTGSTAAVPAVEQTVAKPSCEQSTAPPGEWEMSEDPAFYPTEPPHRSNLSYNLWTLGNIRLLVRSHCHGNITTYRKPMYHVELSPKLEYQPMFGLEQVTPSEAARNWTSLYIHNNCRLVRARINCFTSEVMMLEEVDLRQVIPPRCPFQPASAVSVLHRVLTKLHSLSSGQYLLSHTPGSGHANLKKSTHNDIGAYDLHRAHSGSTAMDVSGNHTVPWIPIDTSILLPHHKKYHRIPATFEPKDAAAKFQPKAQQKQKKKKKRKKKGKGQTKAATGELN